MLIGALFSTASALDRMDPYGGDDALLLLNLSAPFLIYSYVVFLLLIYKMWKAVPVTVARTTPGKAVGFLFIPVFNLYWLFQALWGWSRDWNSYAANSETKLQRIPEVLPLLIAVIWVASAAVGNIVSFAGMPGVGLALSAPIYVLLPIFISMVCDRLNEDTPYQSEDHLYGVAILFSAS